MTNRFKSGFFFFLMGRRNDRVEFDPICNDQFRVNLVRKSPYGASQLKRLWFLSFRCTFSTSKAAKEAEEASFGFREPQSVALFLLLVEERSGDPLDVTIFLRWMTFPLIPISIQINCSLQIRDMQRLVLLSFSSLSLIIRSVGGFSIQIYRTENAIIHIFYWLWLKWRKDKPELFLSRLHFE